MQLWDKRCKVSIVCWKKLFEYVKLDFILFYSDFFFLFYTINQWIKRVIYILFADESIHRLQPHTLMLVSVLNQSIFHPTPGVKTIKCALMNSVIFTPQSGLSYNLFARLSSFCSLRSQQIFFLHLISEVVTPSWCLSPMLSSSILHDKLVLIFASFCRQVVAFNSRGRKIKAAPPHNKLSKGI